MSEQPEQSRGWTASRLGCPSRPVVAASSSRPEGPRKVPPQTRPAGANGDDLAQIPGAARGVLLGGPAGRPSHRAAEDVRLPVRVREREHVLRAPPGESGGPPPRGRAQHPGRGGCSTAASSSPPSGGIRRTRPSTRCTARGGRARPGERSAQGHPSAALPQPLVAPGQVDPHLEAVHESARVLMPAPPPPALPGRRAG